MAGLPQFLISTQTDPYWEIPFYDTDGKPLSVEGRVFEAWIAPATSKTGVGQPVEPLKVLRFGDGLSLVPPTDGTTDQTVKNTFVHQVTREFAQANFPRGELTADILEVVGSARRLLVPVRLRYDDPAAIRDFVADRAGIVFGGGRQPVVTPVAVAGQTGRRGTGFLTGTLPPQPADGEDGDYWVVDREGQANLLYGPKEAGAWPAQPSSTLGVGGVGDVPGLGASLTSITAEVEARFILVPTLLDLATVVIPDDVATITVARYRANTPAAPAIYRRLDALPAHALAAQDARGQWWGLAERRIAVEVAGAAGNGADDALPLDRARYYAEANACPVVLARPYFSSQATDFRNVVLEPAPAAKLTGRIDFQRFGKVLSDLPVSIDIDGIRFDTVISAKDRRSGLDKGLWMTGGSAARAARSYRALDCTAIQRQHNSYPGSDVWTDTPGTIGNTPAPREAAVNSNQMAWNVTSGGIWYCGFVPVHGGQCLRAHHATVGTYTRGAFVRTSVGYYGFFAGAEGEVTQIVKLNGQQLAQRQFPPWAGLKKPDGSLLASAQQPGVSNWELEFPNHQTFRLKLNGQDVSGSIGILSGAEIYDAGFGVFASANVVQPVIDFWSKIDTIEATGRAPCMVPIFGDSQAAPRNGDISNAIFEALDGTNGIRVLPAPNLAIGGTNTAGALDQLGKYGIGAPSYRVDIYPVLMTLVNNQQQGSGVPITVTHVGAWIDEVRNRGGNPVVVIEPRFFSREEGNPLGFVTAYAGSPDDYRGAVMNVAAGRGAIIVDLNEVLGPIVPRGLSGAFEIIEDNIHLTPYGKRLAGFAIAQAIAAHTARPLTACIAQKQMPPRFANGWAGVKQYPTYSVTADGVSRRIFLGGIFTKGGPATNGTLMYSLPRNLWPKSSAVTRSEDSRGR